MIQTAEKLLANNIDGLKDAMLPDTKDIFEFYKGVICEFAKEFAKYHVKAAIKMCIEEAPSGSSTDTVSYEDVVHALKDCYPLENIK
jgi:hypothetical protein